MALVFRVIIKLVFVTNVFTILSSWNNFRTLCNNEKKLFPVLELEADVPDELEIARWLGEPVRAIFISPGEHDESTVPSSPQ